MITYWPASSDSACMLFRSATQRISVFFFPESKLQMYISTLPPYARSLLDKELDWDNKGVDKDLVEIADKMIHWEEKGLHTLLELDHIDIHDIEDTYKYKDKPVLKRYNDMGVGSTKASVC